MLQYLNKAIIGINIIVVLVTLHSETLNLVLSSSTRVDRVKRFVGIVSKKTGAALVGIETQ